MDSDLQPQATNNETPVHSESGAPNTGGAPRRKRKLALWIGTAVVVVLLIIVALSILPAKTNAPSNNTTTSTTSSQTKKATIAGEPVVCGNDPNLCVPNVDRTRDVAPKLQADGFTCGNDPDQTYDYACLNNNGQKIGFSSLLGGGPTDTHIISVAIEANTKAVGNNPPDQSGETWKLNNDTFHKAISAIFAQYPKIQQDMNAWLAKQTGSCAYPSSDDHDVVDGYYLSCQAAVPEVVSGNNLTVTTWGSLINLSTPLDD